MNNILNTSKTKKRFSSDKLSGIAIAVLASVGALLLTMWL
jgi:hypothetical protein